MARAAGTPSVLRPSALRQFGGLWVKRRLQARRDMLSTCCQLFFPVLLVLAALALLDVSRALHRSTSPAQPSRPFTCWPLHTPYPPLHRPHRHTSQVNTSAGGELRLVPEAVFCDESHGSQAACEVGLLVPNKSISSDLDQTGPLLPFLRTQGWALNDSYAASASPGELRHPPPPRRCRRRPSRFSSSSRLALAPRPGPRLSARRRFPLVADRRRRPASLRT